MDFDRGRECGALGRSRGRTRGRGCDGGPGRAPSTATWSDPPARSAVTAPVAVERRTEARPAPACTAQAWAPLPSGCDARGRPVRIIALTQR
ncbi:hypothetical protein ACFQWF_22085 [Methylorubrum suomiense]